MGRNEDTQYNFDLKQQLSQYCPNLVAFYGINSKNWRSIDKKFAKRLTLLRGKIRSSKTESVEIETTIFDLVQLASCGHKPQEGFLQFIDTILLELTTMVDKRLLTRLRKGIIHPLLFNFGKDNFRSKYLEPVGELGSLRQLLRNPIFELNQIEFELPGIKGKKGIDFSFRYTKSSRTVLVEVLNIELKKEHLSSFSVFEKHLYSKVGDKVSDKTVQLNKLGIKLPNLNFLIVLWCFDLKKLAEYYAQIDIAKNQFEYPILELCTFAQRVDANNTYSYVFGTVKSILEMYQQ